MTVPEGKTVNVVLDWAGTANADDIKSSTLGDKLPTSVSIAGGTSQTEFTLTTEDDAIPEETETLIPTITDVTDDNAFEAIKPSLTANGAQEDAITTTTEIVDNDEILVASITSDEVVEGNELEHTVTLNTTSTTPTTVNVTLTSGTATVGTDTGTPVKVSFDDGATWEDVTMGADGTFDVSVPAGKDSFKVQVPSTEDWDYEKPNEQYTISAAIGNQTAETATGTIIDPDWVRVSEEGLTDDANHLFDGIKDTTGQDNDPQALDGLAPDTTDSATATGNLALQGNITNIEYMGNPITTAGGKAVIWDAWNTNTNELVAKNADGEKIITISVNGDNYTATLHAPVDHTLNDNIEDVLDLKFKAIDSNNETARFVVGIEDDMPDIADIAPEITVDANLKVNLLVALDLSGSMLADKDGNNMLLRQNGQISLNPDFDGTTKLALAKEAIENLMTTYADYGDVKVKIVGFADTAVTKTSNWVDVTDAINALNKLVPEVKNDPNGIGRGTNYDAALAESKRAFEEDMNGYLTDGTNQLYFLTDGKPVRGDGDINALENDKETNQIWINPKTGQPTPPRPGREPIDVGINDTEKDIWETFVKGKKINVHAVGFGDAVQAPIDPIAYDGAKSEDADGVIVKADGLKNQLEKMIEIKPVDGDIINSASNTDPVPKSELAFGADKSVIKSVTIDNKDFLYDYETNKVTDVSTGAVTENTATIKLMTAKGSELSLDMRTGGYKYKAHPSVAIAGGAEDIVIEYSVKDKDGDEDRATTTLKFRSAHGEQPASPVVEITAVNNPNEVTEGLDGALVYQVRYENNATILKNSVVKVKVALAANTVTADDIDTITYYDMKLGAKHTLNTPEEIQDFFANGIDVKIYGSQNSADNIVITAKTDDLYNEVNENLKLAISKPIGATADDTNYTIGNDKANGVIINNNLPPIANDDSWYHVEYADNPSYPAKKFVEIDVINSTLIQGTGEKQPTENQGVDIDPENSLDNTSVMIVGATYNTAFKGYILNVADEGLWICSGKDSKISFIPNQGFTGDPTPIQYTVTDNGRKTSNPATVTLKLASKEIKFFNEDLHVSEEGLPADNGKINIGLKDNSDNGTQTNNDPNDWDKTDSITDEKVEVENATSVTFLDANLQPTKQIGNNTTLLWKKVSDERMIAYSDDNANGVKDSTDREYLQVDIIDNVKFKATLLDNIAHPNKGTAEQGIEDIVTLELKAEATNGAQTKQGTVKIVIEDDMPEADLVINDTIGISPITTNLLFTIDNSGSMKYVPGVSEYPVGREISRWDITREAIVKLVEEYSKDGNTVNVNFATFSSGAGPISGWMKNASVAEINDFFNNIKPDGGTNYPSGLRNAMQAWNSSQIPEADQNVGYFVSDGVSGTGQELGNPNNAQTLADWRNFLADKNINKSYAVGFTSQGTDTVDPTELNLVSHNTKDDGTEMTKLITSADELNIFLGGTVDLATGGNTVAKIDPTTGQIYGIAGADDLDRVVHVVYKENINSNIEYIDDNNNGHIVVRTKSGDLDMNIHTGEYAFSSSKAKIQAHNNVTEKFLIKIEDTDGDVGYSHLNIDVIAGDAVNRSVSTFSAMTRDASEDTVTDTTTNDSYSINGDKLLINPNETINLDFDNISNKVENIKEVNMEDNSNLADKLTIDAQDVLDMTSGDNTLFIKGDSSDIVNLDNSEGQWQQQATSDQAGYNMYTGTNNVTLYIDVDVNDYII
ncbi:MAG: VWA domain-containing protein [Gammaproteobacteria bacterium]|nr:VWA domain-containing protein [Gammaproteobacteria bacterium]